MLWQSCGAEEVWVLAHVQREGLPQVGRIPGEGAGHKSAVEGGHDEHRSPCQPSHVIPNNVPEQFSVRFVRVEMKYVWFQLPVLQSIAKQNSGMNEVDSSLTLQ